MLNTTRRLAGALGLLLLIALFSAPAGLAQVVTGWQAETVDSDGDVGRQSSLAIDGAGRPHICYLDASRFGRGSLKYAVFDGTSWQIETVDEGITGFQCSLALDGAGQPHISYLDRTDLDLKYATFDGAGWQIETVDAGDIIGTTSLALDSAGQPHISYLDNGLDVLRYAAYDGSAWRIQSVDAIGQDGRYSSLALDDAGRPHISYLFLTGSTSNATLRYARFDGAAWQFETVAGPDSQLSSPSLALDGAGRPHIGYHDIDEGDLKYATFDGVSWQLETVDAEGYVGEYTSLAVDSHGHPHISYNGNDHLKYAAFNGTSWQIETADPASGAGWDTSLALDSDNTPHISHYDAINGDLKYARALLNHPPAVDAGGPYGGVEGSPVSLVGTVSDPESDALTTAWTYAVDDADPGTTCAFGNAGQVDTTFTCTDDGTFTVTLEASDGLNPAVTSSASVTIANTAPTTDEPTASLARNQVTINVVAADPGENDVLSYAFDCDANGTYEVDAGAVPAMTCALNPQQEGSFTFSVRVSDDDGGVTTDSVTVTIASQLCASNHTGLLRYSEGCQSHETAITIPDPNGPVTVCASTHSGLLRSPANGLCASHEIGYALPGDGPLSVCVNTYTRTMRVVDDITQCTSNEFGRVIAATEIEAPPSPRTR